MRRLQRLLREPVVHFFTAGALLFALHRAVVGDPRTITVSPGLRAELARRFQDQKGRAPDSAELETALRQWEREEALFREALREHLDRGDPAVRSALIDKMHARAAFEVPKLEPTEAELASWFESHRARYETPPRYDFEFLAFRRADAGSEEQIEMAERAIQDGANPATLGRPLIGGDLSVLDMKDRVEPELMERIPALPLGQWQRVDCTQNRVLVRVKHVEGGAPTLEAARSHVVADWTFAARQEAIDRILQRTVGRYRFDERP